MAAVSYYRRYINTVSQNQHLTYGINYQIIKGFPVSYGLLCSSVTGPQGRVSACLPWHVFWKSIQIDHGNT
jgi:hypothetical protein